MGSRGTNSFTDYSNARSSGSGGQNGGSSGGDACLINVTVNLQEVPTSPYFSIHSDVPAVGSDVDVKLDSGRIAIEYRTIIIGYLPTTYNYLVKCLNDGYRYSGKVIASHKHGVPKITVTIGNI